MAEKSIDEADVAAFQGWSAQFARKVAEAHLQAPSTFAREAEAREQGTSGRFPGLAERLLAGIPLADQSPEEVVRGAYAMVYGAHEIIVEMLQAHRRQTGTTLGPPLAESE